MTRRYTITYPGGQAEFWTPGPAIARFMNRTNGLEGFPSTIDKLTILNSTLVCFPSEFVNNPEVSECLKGNQLLLAWNSDGVRVEPYAVGTVPKDGWIDPKKSPPPYDTPVFVQCGDGNVTIGRTESATLGGLRWTDEKGMTLIGEEEVILWQPLPIARKH